ncbi:DUF2513 domain-containing protein [Edwardsiella piscicida]|uniref:DUF2513 domain-containing protein n=1 Tax=Edwardsiella piscicida TaxID=1263550 RepID=UPI000932C6C6|nr:DUF2513 domain-containing protein [Edwardsiella piscicida]
MKIDHDYLKGLLEAFEASQSPQTDIYELERQGFKCDSDIFLFHIRLLDDRYLITRTDGESGFGLVESADGIPHWAAHPLRLTASGHDFLEALRNQEIWAVLKGGFKDASMETLITVSKELLSKAVKKQLSKYFE